MHIQWTYSGNSFRAPVESAAVPYCRALGFELAARVMLELGGSAVYVKTQDRASKSKIAGIIGVDGIARLRDELGGSGEFQVPLARKFLATYYCSIGLPIAEIARLIRVTETTVRRYCGTAKRNDGRPSENLEKLRSVNSTLDINSVERM